MTARIRLQLLNTKEMGVYETFLSPMQQRVKRILLIVLTILFCASFVTSVALLAFTDPFYPELLVLPTVGCGGTLLLAAGLFSAINYWNRKNSDRYYSNFSFSKFSSELLRNEKKIPFFVKYGYLTVEESKKLHAYFHDVKEVNTFTKRNTRLIVTDNEKFSESQRRKVYFEATFVQDLELKKKNPNLN